jgi:hypothetical protein
MMPNISRGDRVTGLMSYLAGPGRHNEHEEQHLVAGDPAIMAMHGYAVLDRETAMAVARSIDMPRKAFGTEVSRVARMTDSETGEVMTHRVAADVWHCSLSLRAEEGQLSDEKWGAIAQDFVDRMGFTEAGGKAACRWVAVRHGLSTAGNDHVHLAVSLVREDGTKASTHNDFKRAQDVCRQLEVEYGLEQLESRDRGIGERGIKPGERERAARTGAVEIDAHRLERAVRAAATSSLDEGEFVRRMRRGGVLIRPRFAAGRDDVIAGYSVALRPTNGAQPIWFGGGRLARDLTLPRLREGWPDSVDTARRPSMNGRPPRRTRGVTGRSRRAARSTKPALRCGGSTPRKSGSCGTSCAVFRSTIARPGLTSRGRPQALLPPGRNALRQHRGRSRTPRVSLPDRPTFVHTSRSPSQCILGQQRTRR